MASSPVAICNVALARMGQPPIMSLEDNTNTARLCAIAYDPSRKAMLRAMRPDFAKKHANVPALDEEVIWVRDYGSVGLLPSDCFLVTDIDLEEGKKWAVKGRHLFIEGDLPVAIEYIRDETNTTRFDVTFEDALADQIAAEISFGLTKNIAYREKFYATAAHKAALAQNVDAQQGSPEIPPANQLIDVRFGGGGA